jgi:hypothetical protein
MEQRHPQGGQTTDPGQAVHFPRRHPPVETLPGRVRYSRSHFCTAPARVALTSVAATTRIVAVARIRTAASTVPE